MSMDFNRREAQNRGVNEAIQRSLESGSEVILIGDYLAQLLSFRKYLGYPSTPFEITYGGSEGERNCTLTPRRGKAQKSWYGRTLKERASQMWPSKRFGAMSGNRVSQNSTSA